MNSELFEALELLEKEKGIAVDYMLERVEAALVSAYKRDRNGIANVRVDINKDKKSIRMFEQKNIVEEVLDPEQEISLEEALKVNKRYSIGGICEIELKPKNFRRLSAQTAKQVIIQGIREAERSMMIKEYESKKEEIITAIVDKVDPENEDVLVDTGTSKVYLKKAEQIPGESYEPGDLIRVYVLEVHRADRGPLVRVSRTHPNVVRRLFELETPEIAEGQVEIRNIAREAGSRSKIAVRAAVENVDPVGACVGPRGGRVGAVVDELCGEKIDIVVYSEDPCEYVKAALSPADVVSVTLVPGQKACRVIVPDDQLSLAIGKEGQNARLAARLTGYKIDIKPVSQAEADAE